VLKKKMKEGKRLETAGGSFHTVAEEKREAHGGQRGGFLWVNPVHTSSGESLYIGKNGEISSKGPDHTKRRRRGARENFRLTQESKDMLLPRERFSLKKQPGVALFRRSNWTVTRRGWGARV